MPAIWEEACKLLQQEIPAEFELWVKPIQAQVNGKEIHLFCPDKYHLKWLNDYHLEKITSALNRSGGDGKKVTLLVSGKVETKGPERSKETRRKKTPSQHHQYKFPGTNLCSEFTFANFIVGEFNESAKSLAKLMLTPGKVSLSGFVFGGTGLGKSHLLQAVAHEAIRMRFNVQYISTLSFVNMFFEACRNKTVETLKSTFAGCDMLLVDDVQLLKGKDKTQELLREILDLRKNSGKRTIFSGNSHPNSLKAIPEELISRFAGSVIIEIGLPNTNNMVAILRRKIQDSTLEGISDDVINYIAKMTQGGDIRVLEGVLMSISIRASSATDVNLAMAREVFRESPAETEMSLGKIADVVSRAYRVDVLSRLQGRDIVNARNIAMFLAKHLTQKSDKEIGAFFARTHTIVGRAVRLVGGKMRVSPTLAEEIKVLQQRLS